MSDTGNSGGGRHRSPGENGDEDVSTTGSGATHEPADEMHGENRDEMRDEPGMTGPGDSPPTRSGATGERRHEPVRTTIRTVGELLVTAGVVVLLFVVYELWITNIIGAQKQAEATARLDKLWAQESDVVTAPADPVVVTESGGAVVTTVPGPTREPGERTRHYDTTEGAGFAKLYIPAFGPDFMFTVVEGTVQRDLYKGPGHYIKTQYPGQPGNFALAGHRVNKGAPFDDLGLLHSCDAVVIETVDHWYVYRVLPMQSEAADWDPAAHAHCDKVDAQTGAYQGVYGREIVDPSAIEEVFPVPHSESRAVPTGAEKLITLTTCHPKFSDRERMIIHGILVASYPKSDGFAPPQMQETS